MNLETERLIIRDFKLSDIDDLYEIFSNEEVMEYIEPVYDRNKTLNFLKEFCIEHKGAFACGIYGVVQSSELSWLSMPFMVSYGAQGGMKGNGEGPGMGEHGKGMTRGERPDKGNIEGKPDMENFEGRHNGQGFEGKGKNMRPHQLYRKYKLL